MEGKSDDDAKAGDSVAKEWTKSLLVAVVLFVVIRTFILQTFVITSGSMEGALLVGDFLIANRAAVGVRIPWTQARIPGYSSVRRGDVLVFDPPHEPDLKLVKRLIAIEGDTVAMKDGALTINGQLQDEPYVKHLDPDPRESCKQGQDQQSRSPSLSGQARILRAIYSGNSIEYT